MSSTLEEEESELIKEPKAQWFFGDVIKRDSREYKTVPTSTKPTVWTPFTEKDSNEIEKKYISFTKRKIDSSIEKSNFKVAVQEDYLSEVDLETLELYSVYWPGPVYEVRRGFWFCAPDGKTFIPCNENLCRQVEAGFWKYKPWKKDISIPGVPTSFSSSENIDQVPSEEKSKPPSTSSAVNSAVQKHATDKPELRWALFGPYMNQYVIYHSQSVAFLLSDLLSSKIYRGVMETISKGENLGGVRLVRGWDEVNKLKKPIVISPSSSVPTSTSPVRSKEKAEDEQNDKSKIEAPRIRSVEDLNLREEKEVKPTSSDIENVVNDFINSPRPSSNYLLNSESEDRQIDHLIFVIHGIGQKLGERIDSISLVNDCNMLRSTLKSSSKLVRESMVELNVPDGSGVQVLPIQWRQKVQFGTSDKLNKNSKNSDNETDATWSTDAGDVSGSAVKKKPSKVLDEKLERVADTASLENITLDGVPSIRMLVSDVILDLLLYMTPKYRQSMIDHVTNELNRMYLLFKSRNKNFNGKVSIYAHSLGSLLAFDILSNQKPAELDKKNSIHRNRTEKGDVDLGVLLHTIVSGENDSNTLSGSISDTQIKYNNLNFNVNKLFSVGSPLGLFLLLRGELLRAYIPENDANFKREKNHGISRPKVNSIYNIFHPHDPVSYRLEPLFDTKFSEMKPELIGYTKGGLKGKIVGIQDLSNDIMGRGFTMLNSIKIGVTSATTNVVNTVGSVLSANSSRKNSLEGVDFRNPMTLEDSPKAENSSNIFRDDDITNLNPRGRLDFSLQEGVLENPYLTALAIHMNYWSDQDVSVFMLKELYSAM